VLKTFSFLLVLTFCSSVFAEWNIDLSRRTQQLEKYNFVETHRSDKKEKKESVFDSVFSSSEPMQEIVILNTVKGFVPKSVRVRKGQNYKINVVNVNPNDKNVSFIMDAFSVHQATYFGEIKSFFVKAKRDGIYSYQCPETSAQGRLVVVPQVGSPSLRRPASQE